MPLLWMRQWNRPASTWSRWSAISLGSVMAGPPARSRRRRRWDEDSTARHAYTGYVVASALGKTGDRRDETDRTDASPRYRRCVLSRVQRSDVTSESSVPHGGRPAPAGALQDHVLSLVPPKDLSL